MEQKNISLNKGIHRTPSLGDAGELSECVNLIPKNGELVNIPTPNEMTTTIPSGHTLLYVHSRSGENAYTNYITGTNSAVYLNGVTTPLLSKKAKSVTSVGNTLCVATSEGTYYFLWKNSSYINLGNTIPEVPILVGAYAEQTSYMAKKINTYSSDVVFVENNTLSCDIETSREILDYALGTLNTVEESEKKEGRFMYPFFVRYAIKLYDGSYTKPSSPILIIPTDDALPIVVMEASYRDSGDKNLQCAIYYNAICLGIKSAIGNSLDNWNDIISGVTIFVSEQVQGYNESASIDSRSYGLRIKGYTSSDYSDNHYENKRKRLKGVYAESLDNEPSLQVRTNYSSLCYDAGTAATIHNFYGEIEIENVKKSTLISRLESCSTFYKIKDLSFQYVKSCTSTTRLDIDEYVLQNLLTQESLVEDTGYSHYGLISSQLFSYNSRLIAADNSMNISTSMDLSQIIQNSVYSSSGSTYACVEIERDGITSYVNVYSQYNQDYINTLYYAFFPDPFAKNLYLYSGSKRYKLKLKPHESLMGSFWMNDLNALSASEETSTIPSVSGTSVNKSNVIYISETDNPFVFKGSNAVTLPGRVIDVSTASKALSQGQFGQFPLYAFCEDGIWALSIGNNGKLESKQPINRDVILSGSSVCQLDDSVAYITNEGVKIIRGSESRCISTPIHGNNLNDTNMVKAFLPTDSTHYSFVPTNDILPFQKMLTSSTKMLFDSTNRLIHVFGNEKHHYVYDMDSSEWSIQHLNMKTDVVVPGYPLSIMQSGTSLYQYKDSVSLYENTGVPGYFLTRPDYMGDMHARKCIYDLRVMGQLLHNGSYAKVTVLVSNDLKTWAKLRSLKGMSAKYYRYLVRTLMSDIETIQGISVKYEERYSHKFR